MHDNFFKFYKKKSLTYQVCVRLVTIAGVTIRLNIKNVFLFRLRESVTSELFHS